MQAQGVSHTQGSLDQARQVFEDISNAVLDGILDNLTDRFNGHELVIAHDAAVVDKEQ